MKNSDTKLKSDELNAIATRLKELRKENLLSIKYGDLESQNYSDRQANIYTPKPLYDIRADM